MSSSLPCVKPNAAGIDVGSKSHFVAVPANRDPNPVKEFGFFTEDLEKLTQWLKECRIETVAREATGSFWIPLYDVLIERNIEVYLVNARHIENVSGRKTDVQDCQWIQPLHSCGLLKPSFIPNQLTAKLRHFVRHRDALIRRAATELQLMQKALVEMNLQLQNIVSDISEDTGMRII
jgi:transposase